MLFDDRLEGLGRSVVVEMRFDEILHHRSEVLIARLAIPHQPPQHMQDVRAFGVNDLVVSSRSSRSVEPEAHPERARVVRTKTELVFIENALAMAFPELQVPVEIASGILQVKAG